MVRVEEEKLTNIERGSVQPEVVLIEEEELHNGEGG